MWEVFPELVGTETERVYRRALAGTEPVSTEHWSPVLRRWVHARLFPSPEGLAVSFRDISERQRHEEALHDSEDRFRAMFENSLDALMMGSPEGEIFAANPAACALLGRTEAECRAEGRGSVVVEDEPRFGAFLATRDRDGHARAELTIRRKGGGVFPAEVSAALFTDRAGRRRTCVSIRDLSARKSAEAALHMLTEAGRLLPSSLDADATVDALAQLAVPGFADAAVVDVVEPEGLRRVYAVACRGDARGRPSSVRPTGEPRGCGVTRVLATGEPELVPTVTDAWLRAAGEEVADDPGAPAPAAAVIVPLVARGATVGALSFVRQGARPAFVDADVALARRLADRLALALDHARLYAESVRARTHRDELLGVVSHDLRNPLNTILLNARLLRRTAPGEALEAICAAAVRADRLVGDLVAITAIESGRLPLASAPQPVGALAEEVAALHRTIAEARSIALEVSVDEATPQAVVDAHRLVQALSNLVGNALKFAPEQSVVTLRVRRERGGAAIDVVDRGPGVPAEYLPRLFDRFWQARPGAHQGVGLGLAIARGIVEAHGGELRVATTQGGGATFTVLLPPP